MHGRRREDAVKGVDVGKGEALPDGPIPEMKRHRVIGVRIAAARTDAAPAAAAAAAATCASAAVRTMPRARTLSTSFLEGSGWPVAGEVSLVSSHASMAARSYVWLGLK